MVYSSNACLTFLGFNEMGIEGNKLNNGLLMQIAHTRFGT